MKILREAIIVTIMTVMSTQSALSQTPAPDHFRGIACVVTASPICADSGFVKNMCAKMRYKPFNYGKDPGSTKLTLNWEFFSQNFTYAGGSLIGTTLRNVNQSGHNNDQYTLTSQMRIVAQAPANPNGALFVTGTMDINTFFPSCNIRFRFAATKMPT